MGIGGWVWFCCWDVMGMKSCCLVDDEEAVVDENLSGIWVGMKLFL